MKMIMKMMMYDSGGLWWWWWWWWWYRLVGWPVILTAAIFGNGRSDDCSESVLEKNFPQQLFVNFQRNKTGIPNFQRYVLIIYDIHKLNPQCLCVQYFFLLSDNIQWRFKIFFWEAVCLYTLFISERLQAFDGNCNHG